MHKLHWKTNTWLKPHYDRSGYIIVAGTKETIKNITAKMGCVVLVCTPTMKSRSDEIKFWTSTVDLGSCETYNMKDRRIGKTSKSLDKCKEDTIRLAKELLMDYHTVITKTMKCFGGVN